MTEMLLVVILGGQRAALPTDKVNSVIELTEVTPAPRAPHHIAGLAALRSRPLTVIDCAASLGIGKCEGGWKGSRTVVVEHEGHLYGLLVDSADAITSARGELEPLGADPGPGWRSVAQGRIETEAGSLLLFDVAALIAGAAPVPAA